MCKLIFWFFSLPLFAKAVGILAELRRPRFLVHWAIRGIFIRYLRVNQNELDRPIEQYTSVLDFFTRRLKAGVRVISKDSNAVISPVDGEVMMLGSIQKDKLYQIKDSSYSLASLIGAAESRGYQGGNYIVIYLSPRDYHRVHHLESGTLTKIDYRPGRLLPVHHRSLRCFHGVFVKNKRVIFHYDLPLKMVMVGAANVGRIVLCDLPDFFQKKQKLLPTPMESACYSTEAQVPVHRGDEAGIFQMGSSVIVLFPPQTVTFRSDLKAGIKICLGESIGRWLR